MSSKIKLVLHKKTNVQQVILNMTHIILAIIKSEVNSSTKMIHPWGCEDISSNAIC